MSKILVISDAHGNLTSVQEILNSTEWDYLFFLGDAPDYGPNVKDVVDLLRNNVTEWVMGNHDNAVAFGVDCKCGEKTHELSVYTRQNISLKQLNAKDISFLKKRPISKKVEIDGLRFFLVHAAPRDPLYGYLYPWLDEKNFIKMLKTEIGQQDPSDTQFILLGHTHYQFQKNILNYRIINPGSAGQPRDGDPRVGFCVIDTKTMNVTFQRIKYDVNKTINSLKALNLDKQITDRLISILKNGKVE